MKKKEKEDSKPIWYDGNPKPWKSLIIFYDMGHVEVGVIEEKSTEVIPGTTNIITHITSKVKEKISSLFWQGFILRAGCEIVTPDMIYDDINYLRKEDGTMVFICEDKDCNNPDHPFPNVRKVHEEKKCVVCKNQIPNRIFPCLHICSCEQCFEKVERCPICRRRKPNKI